MLHFIFKIYEQNSKRMLTVDPFNSIDKNSHSSYQSIWLIWGKLRIVQEKLEENTADVECPQVLGI